MLQRNDTSGELAVRAARLLIGAAFAAVVFCFAAGQSARAREDMTPLYSSGESVARVPTGETGALKIVAPARNNIAVPHLLTVTKTADTNDGVCDAADCSLREAIDAADGDGVANHIRFDIPASDPNCAGIACEIDLTSEIFPAADGGNLTSIIGEGPNVITIDAQNTSRHFLIGPNRKFAITGLILQRGNGASVIAGGSGGSILINGAGSELTLNNMTFRDNNNNFNNLSSGGAINCNVGCTLIMTNSTISNNNASNAGGGIVIISASGFDPATATLTNVTISGNTSASGGGINVNGAALNATSLTVTRNHATFSTNTGGIRQAGGAIVNICNSIVAGNTNGSQPPRDVQGTFVSGGYNFIGGTDDALGSFPLGNPNANNDYVGAGFPSPLDPRLQPLADNGGATETHALSSDSPALDKGNSFGATEDQRGAARPFDLPTIANATGGDGSDIGAFEAQLLYDFRFFEFSDLLSYPQYSKEATAGSEVPIRFSLGGFVGNNPYSSPPVSQRINYLNKNPIGQPQPIQTNGGAVNYNATFDFYQTIWRTQTGWAGTCRRLTLFLKDGTTQTLDLRFK